MGELNRVLEAALLLIRHNLDRVMWNINQADTPSPFDNTGARFANDTFRVWAYGWGDNDNWSNFQWEDVEVYWYKYFPRGLKVSKPLSLERIAQMLDSCLGSLDRMDNETTTKPTGA